MFKVGDRVRALATPRRRGRDAVIVAPRDQSIGREGVVSHIHNQDPDEEGYYGVQFEIGHDAISGVHLELVTPATPPQTAPTLRDQFAMAAMQAVNVTKPNFAALASAAYEMADAMLAARDGKAGAA